MADAERIVFTDPARELAELCDNLQVSDSRAGEEFLSAVFGVRSWSREFHQIIFTIIERCDLVKRLIDDLDLDADYKEEVKDSVDSIMNAFSANSMRVPWNQHGLARISAQYTGPVKAVSGQIRQSVSYRKLTGEEADELLGEVADLISWLEDHQIAGQDFIRQALIEGLNQLSFRLERVRWLGWGYTLDSLREVIAAYMLLERGGPTVNDNPDAAAALAKVMSVIKGIYDKVGVVKGVVENGDWLLRAYGAGSLIYQGKPVVTALLGAG